MRPTRKRVPRSVTIVILLMIDIVIANTQGTCNSLGWFFGLTSDNAGKYTAFDFDFIDDDGVYQAYPMVALGGHVDKNPVIIVYM